MTQRDFRMLAGRYSTVAVLAAIAAATTWYITGEDAKVGSDYSHIFYQNPSLIPANLTSLAALHIQTAAMVAQMCVTIGLALAFSRFPRRSSEQPDEMVLALRALTEAVNRLGQLPVAVPPDVLSPEAGDQKGEQRLHAQRQAFVRELDSTSTSLAVVVGTRFPFRGTELIPTDHGVHLLPPAESREPGFE